MRPSITNSKKNIILSPFVFGSLTILMRRLVTHLIRTSHFNENTRRLLHAPSHYECFMGLNRNQDKRGDTTYQILSKYKGRSVLSIQDRYKKCLANKINDRPLNNSTIYQRRRCIRITMSITNGNCLFTIQQPCKNAFMTLLNDGLYNNSAFNQRLMSISFMTRYSFHAIKESLRVTRPRQHNNVSNGNDGT